MLYDQGQLVNVFLDAYAISKDAQYAVVARDVLDYLRRDMTHPDGGLFSAEDADSSESESSPKKKEGLFYVWTSQEVCHLVPTFVCDFFGYVEVVTFLEIGRGDQFVFTDEFWFFLDFLLLMF